MRINCNYNFSFRSMRPETVKQIKCELEAQGASDEEYDEFLKLLDNDYSDEKIAIVRRSPDNFSDHKYCIKLHDNTIALASTPQDAIEFANKVSDLRYASNEQKAQGLYEIYNMLNDNYYGNSNFRTIVAVMDRIKGYVYHDRD